MSVSSICYVCTNNTVRRCLLAGASGAIVSRVSAGRIVTKDPSASTIGRILLAKMKALASTKIIYANLSLQRNRIVQSKIRNLKEAWIKEILANSENVYATLIKAILTRHSHFTGDVKLRFSLEVSNQVEEDQSRR